MQSTQNENGPRLQSKLEPVVRIIRIVFCRCFVASATASSSAAFVSPVVFFQSPPQAGLVPDMNRSPDHRLAD